MTTKPPRRTSRKAKALEANPFISLLREVKPDIDQRLELALTRELQERAADGPEVTDMLTQAQSLSARGGKRLRAALVVAGQKAFERGRPSRWDTAVDIGVAVELLQAYFLIHDDWMDQDETRRGGPSVHAALTKRFRSPHKGASAAILAGDYLVALASRHLVQTVAKHKQLAQLSLCFADMQTAAVTGQQLDVIGITRNAERIYELKTASYTVSGPLRLGALLAGAGRAQLSALDRFAHPLGVAFQLRDDQLGAFADPKTTGKPRGNDIVQGKWTWLVQHALQHGSNAQKRALKAAFAKPQAGRDQVAAACEALEASGAREASEARIRQLTAQSERALNKLRLGARGNALLEGAISALSERAS